MTQADTSTATLDRLRERLAWHVEFSQKLHRPCSADCLNEARKMIDALAAERDEAIDQRNASDFVLALALKMSERRSAERDAARAEIASLEKTVLAWMDAVGNCNKDRDRLREALREIV